jgi:hypothetical protein
VDGGVHSWRKLGLVFRPDPARWWQRSHAALPTVLELPRGLHRVYFASRDGEQRSHVGWFDVDLTRAEIRDASPEPVLAPGPLGAFDDRGVYAASAVRDDGRVLLYTIGWNRGSPSPLFYATIGLAVSTDGGRTFAKHGRAPIMARSDHDPCLVSAPFVLREGARWRMWYVSGVAWEEVEGSLRSVYHVKYAESADGVRWRREGRECFGNRDADERNVSRACVLATEDGYRAWYGFDRGTGYRIGYGESPDGLVWDRRDEAAGILPSGTGWDGGAVTYPCVVRAGDRLFMLYNGDDFGREGIGLATRPA